MPITTISQAEFDALPEVLKTRFQAEGDAFALVEEDVEGLKKSKAQILAEKKQLADRLAELERFKGEIDARAASDEEEKLRAAGEFKKLEERYKARIAEVEQAATERERRVLSNLKQERLTNELIRRGVLADRAKYALADLADRVELVPDDSGFSLRVKDGIGDASEFERVVENMRSTSSFLFSSTVESGSGASGTSGGGAGTPGRKWSELSVREKAEAIRASGGDADAARKTYG